MIEIDGSAGEGGGQVLRTSLALSIVTRQPFRLFNIRAGRDKPGLAKQHLACVRAAQQVSNADVTGDEIGNRDLAFAPQGIYSGKYRFSVGSAGSASLVLQTVLYPLLHADSESHVSIEGGTHNAWAPPLDFVQHAFLPLLKRMGAEVQHSAERLGFYPAGGGLTHTRIAPWREHKPLKLLERSRRELRAVAYVANLPEEIGRKELEIVSRKLGFSRDRCTLRLVESAGPGNALCVLIESAEVTEVVTSFGSRGTHRKDVANRAVKEAQSRLASFAPVGEHLADQLLLPMALCAGGTFRTDPLSAHTTTNISTIRQFLPVTIEALKVQEVPYYATGAYDICVCSRL